MADAQVIQLRHIFDDDDTWVEVPINVCVKCGIGLKKPRRDTFCYVRGEDAHTLMEIKLEAQGLSPRYTSYRIPDLKAWLKGDEWPNAPAWEGD